MAMAKYGRATKMHSAMLRICSVLFFVLCRSDVIDSQNSLVSQTSIESQNSTPSQNSTVSQNSTGVECVQFDPLTFLAEKGKAEATVNYTLPVEYNLTIPVPPVTLKDAVTKGYYLTKDLSKICPFELHLKVLTCNTSDLRTDLLLDKGCEDLVYGGTCISYCPPQSIAPPFDFVCESDDYNSTRWYPEYANSLTLCKVNNEVLKCPDNPLTLYTYDLQNYTIANWTLPTINDSYGVPWDITYQSLRLRLGRLLYVGKYINYIGGINSKGQSSSCVLYIEVKERTCAVPEEEGAVIQGALPNSTYRYFAFGKKICRPGYAFPESYDNNVVQIQCSKNFSSGELYWNGWDYQLCSRKYMPFSCERNLHFKDPDVATGSYEFVYDMDEWKRAMKQNETRCSLRVKRTSSKPKSYNLNLSFPKSTNIATLSNDLCFFEVLLYTGQPDHNTPVKIFDCGLTETVDMKWPTSEFMVIFRLYDNVTDYSASGLLGNGTIDFRFLECMDCDFENVTGIEGNTSSVPFFEYFPIPPCRLTGCLEDSLQGFKVGLHAENRDTGLSLVRKRCDAIFKLEKQVQKICLHQTKPRSFLNYCRRSSFNSPARLTFGSGYNLELYCDDLQGWWCLPPEVQTDYMNITWKNTYRYGSDTQQLWIISVSENQGYQTCAEPIVATTPKPTRTKRPKLKFLDYTKNTIIGVSVSVLGAIASACAGGCVCWKKRKSQNEHIQHVPLSGLESNPNYATNYGVK